MIDRPAELRALGIGLLAALGSGVAYGISAEIVGLTYGIIVVGIAGGWLIGAAVRWAAWHGEPHEPNQRAQLVGLALGIVGWVIGLISAYFISQALIPEASTSLVERLSIDGFFAYFGGLYDAIRAVHLISLALMAFVAGRGAR